MLRLHQLRLPLDSAAGFGRNELIRLCALRLHVPEKRVASARVVKRSVDARDQRDIHFSLTADVLLADGGERAESAVVKKLKPGQATLLSGSWENPASDAFSLSLPPWPSSGARPLVVGAGPAGLFCALALAVRGARPIVLERGQPVERRVPDVEALEADGSLNPESNVLFGEGGAGAFSDGKLTCGLNSPHIRTVLETLCQCGAPEEILTAQRPHIGTDELRGVLRALRARLTALGAEFRFGCRLTGLTLREDHVAAARVLWNDVEDELPADTVFLAIGHSSRDTLQWLYELGVPMRQKPFAVGARIEHHQRAIDRAQYGPACGHPALPPAEYKLNVPTEDGRGAYTFCMCPGGQVVNASSEPGGVNINGMSFHARNGENANAAVLIGVRPEDFGGDHPLAGVAFQRRIERAAFAACGGYRAPCQRVGDFLRNRETSAFGEVRPSYRPGVTPGDIRCCLPAFIADNLRMALPALGRRLAGFDAPDALLTAPEARSSSPVRLMRNERRESPIGGLYPLGEGAGYAGGIVSAAVDGLLAGMEARR